VFCLVYLLIPQQLSLKILILHDLRFVLFVKFHVVQISAHAVKLEKFVTTIAYILFEVSTLN
jgi:hypothetical protein